MNNSINNQDKIISNAGLTAFIVSSDPQYPRTMKNGEEYYSSKMPQEDRDSALSNIKNQYYNMQSYRNSKVGKIVPVIINGDITEFGDKEESFLTNRTYLNRMTELAFPILGNKNQVLISLGNHDYENNVDDSMDNGAAGGMLEWFPKDKPYTSSINFDLEEDSHYQFPIGTTYTKKGSYSYSVTFKDSQMGSGATPIRFINLNNYLGYYKYFETGKSGIGHKHQYSITSAYNWLKQQLISAANNNEIVIVNNHDYYNMSYKEILDQFNVSAIFVGHTHELSNKIEYYNSYKTPIINSGSTFKGDYIIAESVKMSDGSTSLDIFAVKNNNYSAKTKIGTIPLKVAVDNSTINPSDEYVTLYEGNNATQANLGTISLTTNASYNFKKTHYPNDEARSCKINSAKKNRFIRFYDSPDGATNDDYVSIYVKKDIKLPITISSFESSFENEYLKVIYTRKNGLDGKVSRAEVSTNRPT